MQLWATKAEPASVATEDLYDAVPLLIHGPVASQQRLNRYNITNNVSLGN